MKTMNRIETILSLAAVTLVIGGCLLVLRPFVSAILWAMVLCYCTWPLFARLERRLRHRRTLAAAVMTLLIGLVLVLPFVVVGLTLAESVSRIETVARSIRGLELPAPPEWVQRIPVAGPPLAQSWTDLSQDTGRVAGYLKTGALESGKWLLRHSGDLAKGVMQLALSVLIAFAFYRNGEKLVERIVAGGQRLLGDSTQRLMGIVGSTVRSVVFGIIGTGMAQAILAALGFLIAGVPSAFLLGLLTFVLAFVPVGPPLVWLPATAWLLYDGRPGWGIFLGLWGVLVISGIDNLVRPYLISTGSNLPFVMVLLGVLGGVLAFGFIGLFLGPVLLAVGYSLAREFTAGKSARANAAASQPVAGPAPP